MIIQRSVLRIGVLVVLVLGSGVVWAAVDLSSVQLTPTVTNGIDGAWEVQFTVKNIGSAPLPDLYFAWKQADLKYYIGTKASDIAWTGSGYRFYKAGYDWIEARPTAFGGDVLGQNTSDGVLWHLGALADNQSKTFKVSGTSTEADWKGDPLPSGGMWSPQPSAPTSPHYGFAEAPELASIVLLGSVMVPVGIARMRARRRRTQV